ncbi:nucleotidyltransferase family protein [Nitrospinae bacterium AH_259_B05_G02_I21]|nr:nucleotidyltransferase family protein [Nitrospinae bacterium AH_259_B05_G02_I21]MDA2931704.1 nucleotidyltransferase family protein [Nitrospinae bacterium AH-259-F20]
MSNRLPQLGPDERQLLLNCARLELDGPLLHQTEEILQRPLAWDTILIFAELHSVAPLLHYNLKQFDGEGLIPPEARRRLLQLSHRAGYRNRHYSHALRELLEAFAEAGIPVIVLKGLSLVELIYRNLSLRPLIDLNLLIPRENLEATKSFLLRMGYADAIRYPFRNFYRWLSSQLILVRPGDFEVHVLLQWDVVNSPRVHAIDHPRLWEEAQPVRLSGCDTLIPSVHDLILYLCLQPDKRGYLNVPAVHVEDIVGFVFAEWTDNILIRFTDIYEAIKHHQGTIDWEVLIERARASGTEGSVYASLHWVTKLLGQVVEPWVLDSLRPPSPRRFRKWLFEAIVQEPKEARSATAVKDAFRAWWLKMQKRSQLRLINLLGLLEFIFPRRDEIKPYYRLRPESAVFSVYLIHVAKSLFRSALGFPPWLYCMLTRRRSSATLSEETPSREASHP